jgi:hypothetical protein
MYMPFLMLRKNYFSAGAGGGDITVDTGIVQNIMITAGLIIVVIPLGIEKYLLIGDIVIATICGVDILGILLTSITAILEIIGVVVIGVMTMDGCVPVDIPVNATCMAVKRVGAHIRMGK